jgi:RimJ/RimL family protein N-acetyltransferase
MRSVPCCSRTHRAEMPARVQASDPQPRDADGLLIRELTAADSPALVFAFGRLGDRSRYLRFLGTKTRLGARELDHLTGVDHWHHEALIAWSPVPRSPVGVARYVRRREFDVAEVAIAVVDAWQRHGVGHALLLALRTRALRAGVRSFTATSLWDNRGAIALARKLDSCVVVTGRDGVAELLVNL